MRGHSYSVSVATVTVVWGLIIQLAKLPLLRCPAGQTSGLGVKFREVYVLRDGDGLGVVSGRL